MYGPPVGPLQPRLGWRQHRRFARLEAERKEKTDIAGLSTSNGGARGPYPSWPRSTRRTGSGARCAGASNTPLQALVTLTIGVRGSSAGAGRQNGKSRGPVAEKLRYGFDSAWRDLPGRRIKTIAGFLRPRHRRNNTKRADKAKGKWRERTEKPIQRVARLAVLTAVGNILLNLDELFDEA